MNDKYFDGNLFEELPADVDAETGEVYEVITDEARMIGDGE